MDLSAGELVLLAAAGVAAGAINAVAGGGSLVSFPALMAVGYPELTANVTNMIAVLPGYLGGSYGYRRELAGQGGRARALAAASAAGTLVGAALLLVTPAEVFAALVPPLILFACGLLAVQPLATRLVAGRTQAGHRSIAVHAAVALTCVYGGYFGAGLGIMLLAVLGALLPEDLQRLNALKGLLSLVVGAVAAAFFALLGPVVWAPAGLMAAGSLVGGRAGAAAARRLPAATLRSVVVAYGVVVAVALLLD